MSIGYTPKVTLHGAHEALINSRLISWTHVDASGIESDTLALKVDTQGIDGLPEQGEKISLQVGYKESDIIDKGEFIISSVERRLFPPQIDIEATAAPFQKANDTGFRERRSASYGPVSLGNLFRQLTTRHGFSPRIEGVLDNIQIDHIDQTNETDMAFLTRIASRYDAVTKPWNGLYVMARRGNVKTISGETLPTVTYSVPQTEAPSEHGFMNASVSYDTRPVYSGCKASWWDDKSAKTKVVTVGEAPFLVLQQTWASEKDATIAAENERRRKQRERAKISLDVPGNPLLAAEGLILLDDTWPTSMQGQWSIDKVSASHTSDAGYRCAVEATRPAA